MSTIGITSFERRLGSMAVLCAAVLHTSLACAQIYHAAGVPQNATGRNAAMTLPAPVPGSGTPTQGAPGASNAHNATGVATLRQGAVERRGGGVVIRSRGH
jgi:hypothetical protein